MNSLVQVVLLFISFALSLPARAQGPEVKKAVEHLISTREVFERLKTEIKNLSSKNIIPLPPGDDAFWTELSENDRNVILSFDAELTRGIDRSIEAIDWLAKKIHPEVETLRAIDSNHEQYEARGYQSSLSQKLKKEREEIYNWVSETMNFIIDILYATIKYDNYQNTSYVFNDDGYDLFARQRKLAGTMLMVEDHLSRCENAPCIDHIQFRLNRYIDFIEQVYSLEIAILNREWRLRKWWRRYVARHFKIYDANSLRFQRKFHYRLYKLGRLRRLADKTCFNALYRAHQDTLTQ